MKNELINCKNIFVSFGKRDIIKNVSFSVKKGEIVTIIGPNGSGKTSILRIVCGLGLPGKGDIFRRDGLVIGYMPQKIAIDRVIPLTVRRFLRLNGKEKRLRDVEAVEKIAEEFGILHLMKQQVHDVSGGEMQRVMLARAILLEPDLLVLDEPTQGLDINGQAEFYKLIGSVRDKKGCAVLMVSHDLNMVMAATDRVLCVNQHICCEGAPEDVNVHPEYLSLFGKNAAENVALYTHKHDHVHGVDGCVED